MHKDSKTFSYNPWKVVDILIVPIQICVPTKDETGSIVWSTCKQLNAIWDTWAMRTTINDKIAIQMGMIPFDTMDCNGASWPYKANMYYADVTLLPSGMEFPNMVILWSDLWDTLHALVGMDIITKWDMALTQHEWKTCLSFVMPSYEKIDYVERHHISLSKKDAKLKKADKKAKRSRK